MNCPNSLTLCTVLILILILILMFRQCPCLGVYGQPPSYHVQQTFAPVATVRRIHRHNRLVRYNGQIFIQRTLELSTEQFFKFYRSHIRPVGVHLLTPSVLQRATSGHPSSENQTTIKFGLSRSVAGASEAWSTDRRCPRLNLRWSIRMGAQIVIISGSGYGGLKVFLQPSGSVRLGEEF